MPTTRRAQLRSLAKVNLDLRVLHKRGDGFHELSTVFQTISLADTIGLDVTPARRNRVAITANIDIPDNLLLRAAEAVLRETRVRAQVHFTLEKRIPMGGGLGGGSTNAATVLLALPVLAGFRVPLARLESIAASLGSDVPFFLRGGTALGVGRGTELFPLAQVPKLHGLLVIPGIHVSTAAAYAALNRSARAADSTTGAAPDAFDPATRRIAWLMDAERAAPFAQTTWPSLLANDFEEPVYRQHRQLGAIHRQLRRCGARAVRMSGSGSTIFAFFDSAAAARQSLAGLPWPARAFTTVSRREYQTLWRSQLNNDSLDNEWPPKSRYAS